MSTAFVAGATGFTGREVVKRLAKRGIPIVAHVRADSKNKEAAQKKMPRSMVRIDSTPWETLPMTRTMTELRPTHIFILLGTTRARMAEARKAGKKEDYLKIDFGLTEMLVDAVARSAHEAHFVYLSAAGVGPKSSSEYLQARWRAEQKIICCGSPYTIFRPSFIVGEGRDDKRPMEAAAAKMGDLGLRLVGAMGGSKLKARYSSITNIELANIMVKHSFNERYRNKIVEGDQLRR